MNSIKSDFKQVVKQKSKAGIMISLCKGCLFLFTALLLFSCNPTPEKQPDTPVSGSITVATDESFYPLIKAEAAAFQHLYINAKVNVEYLPEDEAVASLLNGKTDMVIIHRGLNKEENDFILNKKITVRSNKIATDAVAFIVNRDLGDSLITTEQLKGIFTGQLKKWSDISPRLPELGIEIVVDKSTSSNLRFLKQKLDLKIDAINISAAGSNQKVMEYVKKNKISLGIIGVNWISDEDDPKLRANLEQITVLAVGEGDKDNGKYYQPLQAYLAEGSYPFTRSILAITKNTKVGLATGFATYLMSDPGQRIILKAGLLPANMPGRSIEIRNE